MKKILSVVLAIMMLALPVLSMAEEAKAVGMTFTMSNVNLGLVGADEQTAQMAKELLEAIGLRAYGKECENGAAQFGLAITLQGADAVTADMLLDDSGVYVASNFLGQDTVLVTKEQLADLLEALKPELAAQGMDEKQLDDVIAVLRGGDPMSLMPDTNMELDLSNTLLAVEKLADKITECDPATAPEGCDPAAFAITLTLSGDDIADFVNAIITDLESSGMVKQMIESGMMNVSFSAGGKPATKEEMVAQIRASVKEDLVVNIYLSEEEDLVAMTGNMTVQDEAGDEEEMAFIYAKATEDGVSTQTVIVAVTSGEDMITAMVVIAPIDEATTLCDCTISQNDDVVQEVLVTVAESENAVTTDVYVSVPVEGAEDDAMDGLHVNVVVAETSEIGRAVTVVYMPLNSDESIITFNAVIDEMDAVPTINTKDPVQPLTMTEEELNAWVDSLTTNAQMALISLIQLLPPSVLNMALTMMQN